MPAVTRSFTIDRPLDAVWEFFTTPDRVAPAVPGCEEVEELSDTEFNATVAVKVAYSNLTFDTHIEITDQDPPNSMTVEATAEPSGRMPGSATVDAELDLESIDDGSTAGTMTMEFAIRGRLGSLGESAFKHKSEELTDQFIENVADALEGELR